MATTSYPFLYIDGEWVEPHSGRLIPSVDPATGQVWAEVAEADEVDIDRAVAAARAAFESGPWPMTTATERGHMLRKLGDLLLERIGDLSVLESRDSGKTVREAIGEIRFAAQTFYYFAGMADKVQGTTIPVHPQSLVYTMKVPVGVCGLITPWNSPMLLYAWKMAPALAVGCTVVLKPAELSPVTALELARLTEEVGFPKGVINVVPGYGHSAGARLSAHPDVDKISLTGEHRTAQEIMKAATVNLKRLTFECGGKAPHIIFDDANLEKALIAALSGGFINAGQSCSLGSRLFLHERIHDEFLERFAARAARIRVGNPLDTSTQMGAQISEQQLQKTMQYVKIGVDEGARVVVGGSQPADPALSGGYFFLPTILAGVKNEMRVAQEEIFGPVISVIKFKDEAEVIRMANDTAYGLTAGVWTRDIGRAHRVAQRIRAGNTWINQYRSHHWAVPYGGFKMSGWGRENGMDAIQSYTEVKTIFVDLQDEIADPYAD